MGQSISKSHYKTKTFLLRFFKILVYPTWDESIDVCRIFNQNTSTWLGWKIQVCNAYEKDVKVWLLVSYCSVTNFWSKIHLKHCTSFGPYWLQELETLTRRLFACLFSMQERVMVSLESNWIFIWNWKAFEKHDYLKNLVILHPICK